MASFHSNTEMETKMVSSIGGDVEPVSPDNEAVLEGSLEPHEQHEVFRKTETGVDFRTVGWPRASAIFLKGPS